MNRNPWIQGEINLKDQSRSEGILKTKNNCMDQSFCSRKVVSRILIPNEEPNDKYRNVMKEKVNNWPTRGCETQRTYDNSFKNQNYLETTRDNFLLNETRNNVSYQQIDKENIHHTTPAKMFANLTYERITTPKDVAAARKLLASGREDGDGTNSEVKFILGRLLKVKNKLDKQDIELHQRTFNYTQLDNLYNELDREIDQDTRESPFLEPEDQQKLYQKMTCTSDSNKFHHRLRSGNMMMMDRRTESIANVNYPQNKYVSNQREEGVRLEKSYR